MIGLQVEVTR